MVSRRERVVTTSCVCLLPQVVSSPPWIPSDQQKWGFGVTGYRSPEEFVFFLCCAMARCHQYMGFGKRGPATGPRGTRCKPVMRMLVTTELAHLS